MMGEKEILEEKTELEQQQHIKMLADARDILNKHGVFYLLSGSALLGSARDGDLVKWCMGTVLIVKYDDVKKKENLIIEDIKKSGYKVTRHFKRHSNWKIRFDFGRINIEIVGYKKKNTVFRRKYKQFFKIIPAVFWKKPYKEVIIRGEKFQCPGKKIKYLIHLYGKNWVTPIKTKKTSLMRAKTFIVEKDKYE